MTSDEKVLAMLRELRNDGNRQHHDVLYDLYIEVQRLRLQVAEDEVLLRAAGLALS